MRRIMLVVLALVAALGVTASSATCHDGDRRHREHRHDRRARSRFRGRPPATAPSPSGSRRTSRTSTPARGRTASAASVGRQIVFKYLRRRLQPGEQRAADARKLVEEDKVFAIVGALGTEVNLAIRPYLNAEKVPQLFTATGATTLGRDWKEYPWTIGWQPDYEFEGRTTARRSPSNSPTRRSPSSTRTTTTARTTERAQGRTRRQGVEYRRRGGIRGHGAVRSKRDRETQGDGCDGLRELRDAEVRAQSYVFAKALSWSPTVVYTTGVTATDCVPVTRRRRRAAAATWSIAPSPTLRQGSCEPEVGQGLRE